MISFLALSSFNCGAPQPRAPAAEAAGSSAAVRPRQHQDHLGAAVAGCRGQLARRRLLRSTLSSERHLHR
eukprot:7093925-Prymnesium_polylepis.1